MNLRVAIILVISLAISLVAGYAFGFELSGYKTLGMFAILAMTGFFVFTNVRTEAYVPVKSDDFTCREEVMDILRNGGVIYYAPATAGGIALHLHGERTAVQPTLDEFLSLQGAFQIDVASSVTQGHSVFHGHVDAYRLM